MNSAILMHQPASWDAFVSTYEEIAEPITSSFGSALAARLQVQPGERVIDVAAGSGALTLEMAGRGAHVVAVDHSPAMTARLAERAAEAGLDARVSARTMDGQALDLPDSAFDVGLSVFGIMLFPDPDAGLRELVRVLRPGGRAGVAAWRNPEGAAPALLLSRAHKALHPGRVPPPRPVGLANWSDPARLEASLAAAGLIEIDVAEVKHDWVFPSGEWIADNAERLFGMMPIWTDSDPAERGRLLEHVAGQLREPNSLVVPSPALLATGIKPER